MKQTETSSTTRPDSKRGSSEKWINTVFSGFTSRCGPEEDDPRIPSLWEEEAGPFPPTIPCDSDTSADVIIVGAGITGISAALALKRLQPDLRIVMVDSHRPCSGSTSRHCGLLSDRVTAWERLLSTGGAEATKQWNRFGRRGQEALVDFIRSHSIQCDLRREPVIHVGLHTQKKMVLGLCEKMKAIGEYAQVKSGAEFNEKAQTSWYWGGVEDRSFFLAHPGKLARGLLEEAMALGIEVYGDSPVRKTEHTDSKSETHILTTPKARLTSPLLLFATNAYTPRLQGLLSHKMSPFVLAVIMTNPVAFGGRGKTAPVWRTLKEVQLYSRTLGITPENRVFLRGNLGYSPFNSCVWRNEGSYKRLEREMRKRLAYAEHAEIAVKWQGPVVRNPTLFPLTGALPSKGAFASVCFNGMGITQGFYQGLLVAHLMLGESHPDLGFLKGPETGHRIPPEPFRTIGAKTFFFLKWSPF